MLDSMKMQSRSVAAASFVAVFVALALTVFELQNWSMPRLFAIFLITLFVSVPATTLGVQVIRSTWRWQSERSKRLPLPPQGDPGFLDYLPETKDAARVHGEFLVTSRGLAERLTKDTAAYTAKMRRERANLKLDHARSLSRKYAKKVSALADFYEVSIPTLREWLIGEERNLQGLVRLLTHPPAALAAREGVATLASDIEAWLAINERAMETIQAFLAVSPTMEMTAALQALLVHSRELMDLEATFKASLEEAVAILDVSLSNDA